MTPTDKDIARQADETIAAIDKAGDEDDLERLRVAALGKKGSLVTAMKTLADLPAQRRPAFGAALNRAKRRIAAAVEEKKRRLQRDRPLIGADDGFDATAPIAPPPHAFGSLHPVRQTTEQLTAVFADLGFSPAEGPDIETDYYNFTALNIPPSHPARQSQDTFYLDKEKDGAPLLLRTHTSPVQIRAMLSRRPPIRLIAPGRTYRRDSDPTHTPMFHQIEGLVVDRESHLGHLKWTLQTVVKTFFEVDQAPMRFRAGYFPFTEPSLEVDIRCRHERDRLVPGEGDEWLEILGCGMVHPHVLREVGLDPSIYRGFAFGMGLDRLAMLKYGIPDLRAFFAADLDWLRHYGFSAFDQPGLERGLSR